MWRHVSVAAWWHGTESAWCHHAWVPLRVESCPHHYGLVGSWHWRPASVSGHQLRLANKPRKLHSQVGASFFFGPNNIGLQIFPRLLVSSSRLLIQPCEEVHVNWISNQWGCLHDRFFSAISTVSCVNRYKYKMQIFGLGCGFRCSLLSVSDI